MIIPDIVYNLSLMLALCVFSGFLDERYDHTLLSGKLLQGLLFGAIAVVAMMFPYEYAEGILFDGRSIAVGLSTLFFGPAAGMLTTGIAGGYRLFIGGDGMVPGVLLILSAFVLGWIFYHYLAKGAPLGLGKRQLYLFGMLIHLVMVILIVTMLHEQVSDSLGAVVLTILLVHPVITLLTGKILQDQRQQKEHLQKQAHSLREKEVLLSEIHHRVKNNMAIISSLLSLQSERMMDPESRKVFMDTENRVRSMALLHEMVYERKNFAEINMSELLKRLARLISESYGMENRDISIDVDAENITLDMSTSLPFTLLINELVTNAFKHAFPDKSKGCVSVGLHRSNGQIELVVRDDGNGVADVENLRNPDSFGYTIIHGLVRQLRGTIQFESSEEGLGIVVRV